LLPIAGLAHDAAKSDGQWKIGASRVTVYARKALSSKERLGAAAALARGPSRWKRGRRWFPIIAIHSYPYFAIHENSNKNMIEKGGGVVGAMGNHRHHRFHRLRP